MLSKKQQEIINCEDDVIFVEANAAAGKAQPNDTLIPTPFGYKTIGELSRGDVVFNRYGEPEKILQVFPQGKKQVYEVEFADGRITECCEDHLWSYDNAHGGLTTKSLKEMYSAGWRKVDNRGHNAYKYRVPVLRKPVCYPEQTYDIDPYIIGAFIGDSCCTESGLTISSSDEWIVKKIAEIEGFEYKKQSLNNCSWDFFKNNKRIQTKSYFKNYTKELCCHCQEKTIPKKYLIGSYEQRLRLLQGLMDTDGTIGDGKNSPHYSTSSFELAKDVLELIRSLGIYGKIYTKDKCPDKKNIEYTVNIFCDNESAPEIVSLPQEKEKALAFKNEKQRTNHKFDSIVDIRKTEKYKDMTCILVDHPEHLYLTNNFIVTHNTAVIIEKIKKEVAANKGMVVAFTFTNAAADEMYTRLGMQQSDKLFVGTIHSYCCRLLLKYGIYKVMDYLDEEWFDRMFDLIEENPEVTEEPLYCVICDEFQDCNKKQFHFIFDMLKPQKYFCCGDIRQCIYRWRDSHPELIEEYAERFNATRLPLNENYRNGRSILQFAKGIIRQAGLDYLDKSTPVRETYGKVTHVNYNIGAIIKGLKEQTDDYKDWFILTRTNEQLQEVYDALREHGIPCDSFRRTDMSAEQLHQKMQQNTVKVMTIHGCLAGDTLVLTSNGLKPISEIVEKSDVSELVFDGEKFAKVKRFIDNGKAKTLKITTEKGNTIEVTYDHEVCVATENGFKKKFARDLSGDEYLIPCAAPLDSAERKVELAATGLVKAPTHITQDLAELVGMIVGCSDCNTASLKYIHTYYNCIQYSNLIKKIFGIDCAVLPLAADKNLFMCECKSKDIAAFLRLNFGHQTEDKKKIPTKILMGDSALYRAFLLGYFNSTEKTASALKPAIISMITASGMMNRSTEKIISIEPNPEEVNTYCLEMEDKHEFFQNGFLMGNSKGLESKNVMVIGARFFDLEEKCISYVAATRARDYLVWVQKSPEWKVRHGDKKFPVWEK